jgi:alpha-1,6-mannosyltransferase
MHLTNSWHENSGGIATFYRALIAEANRRGQQIRLVVPAALDWIEEAGEFGRIYHIQSPHSPLNSDYRTIYPSQFLFPGSKLQNILVAERPDLVEISDKYTLNYLGALLRQELLAAIDFRPVVVGLSQERMDDNFKSYLGGSSFSQKFCSLYMRWLYFPFFDHHIANSDYTASELRPAAEAQLVPRGTWIRPMGVDLTELSPERRSPGLRRRLLQNFGCSEDSVLLLYAGRLAPEKNLPLLFDLLSHLSTITARDYRLIVAGEGIERRQWEEKCSRQMPGRVLFLGHIKNRQVLADLYASADVFVHPNPREPFGIAPLEAMASGLPLVAPNGGGVASYASAENAWIAEANVASFAEAVEQAATNQPLAAEKARKALATAQSFSWESVAAAFLDLYRELSQPAPAMQDDTARQPAFYSSPAAGFRRLVMHGVSQLAAKSFGFAAALAFQRSSLAPLPPKACDKRSTDSRVRKPRRTTVQPNNIVVFHWKKGKRTEAEHSI